MGKFESAARRADRGAKLAEEDGMTEVAGCFKRIAASFRKVV